MKNWKGISSIERRLLLLWTICCLCVQLSLCDSQPQYHSEEEFDVYEQPPKIFPSTKFIHEAGDALEAADMLNTTNIQHGGIINATELVNSPHVVDLGGKTHQESGNTTGSYSTTLPISTEDICRVPMDWLKGFPETILNYTFPDKWLKDSRGVPLINCTIVLINEEKKLQCPIPSKTKDERNVSSFISSLPEEHIKLFDNESFPACPGLDTLFAATNTNPKFNCSDRIEGTVRITVCRIPRHWLKNKAIITKLNCTDSGNITTDTETCIISKEIVHKNITNTLACESLYDNSVACLLPNEWVKYNVFSVLNCAEQENSTLRNCTFPNNLLTTNVSTQNDCSIGKEGNTTTECPIYNGINCTKNSNSTKMQCQVPEEWLREGNDLAKLNCTDNDSNSTQRVCSIPKEWLRGRLTNVSEPVEENVTNETLCYLPQRSVLGNNGSSELSCTSDNITTTCRVLAEGANITEVCLLLDEIKDNENVLRCTVKYEGNFTIFVCPKSGCDASETETESSSTTIGIEEAENVTLPSQKGMINITTEPEAGVKMDNSSTNDTQITDLKSTSEVNATNTSESSTELAPQLSDTATETQPSQTSNSTSVKLNTEKDQEAVNESVSYEEPAHINDIDGIDITQASTEPNGKTSTAVPGRSGGKMHSSSENLDVHYEPAAPPAAFSQLHSEHSHAPVNEQTVSFLRPTESAAILVGVFIAFAVLGYAGLLIWRRMLEKRYGNRQLLINEDDDFNNANNFEL